MIAPFAAPTDAALAAELAGLRSIAPTTLLPRTLVAVGLAIIVALFRHKQTVSVGELNSMRL